MEPTTYNDPDDLVALAKEIRTERRKLEDEVDALIFRIGILEKRAKAQDLEVVYRSIYRAGLALSDAGIELALLQKQPNVLQRPRTYPKETPRDDDPAPS